MATKPKHPASHEDYFRHAELAGPTNHNFGYTFAVVFGLIGLLEVLRGNWSWPWWLGASAGMAAITLVAPAILRVPNRMWTKLGLLLFSIVSPVVMGFVFFLVVTPVGWLLQVAGKDILGLRLRRGEGSYWIRREPPGPPPESMANQF